MLPAIVSAIATAIAAAGCGRTVAAPDPNPVAVIDGATLDASVVADIARRDGLSPDAARTRAIETMQLAAAARAAQRQREGSDPAPLITDARRAQLLRAARARLWLDEDFAPTTTPADIPADDPLLGRALGSAAFVHPKVHRVCQIVVVPASAQNIQDAESITEDPAWRQRAKAVLEPVRERMRRYVPAGDPEACRLIAKTFSVMRPADVDPDLTLRFEKGVAFDLTACAERADDGSCSQPAFDPAWTETIAVTEPGTYTDVFPTAWGLHLAYLVSIEPERDRDDPATDAWVREQVHPRWHAEQFVTYIERLQKLRAVRIARVADEPKPEPEPAEAR